MQKMKLTAKTQTIWTRGDGVRTCVWCEDGVVVRSLVLDSPFNTILRTRGTNDTMAAGLEGETLEEIQSIGFEYSGAQIIYRDEAGREWETDGERYWTGDPDTACDLSANEVEVVRTVGRPRVYAEPRMRLTLDAPAPLVIQMDAHRGEQTRTAFIEAAIREKLERDPA